MTEDEGSSGPEQVSTEEEPVGISQEDTEAFRAVLEDLRNNIDKFHRKTDPASSMQAPRGSFRNKQEKPRSERTPMELEGKIAALKERLGDAETKNEKLRKKNGDLGNDLSRAKARIDDLMGEVESLTRENEALRKRSRELLEMPKTNEEAKSRCAVLESENTMMRAELERLRAERSTAESAAREREEEASARMAALEARISEQDETIRKLKAGIPLSEIAGSVERVSATQFRSDLFEAERYDVRMARNGSYVTFKPDVEGKVACAGGVLSIPSLNELSRFDGPRSYDAYHFNGGLKVVLR
ncbi:MAG: hypothetical protein IKR86_01885 [Candidatus Methanomethylophilaceae archaeon]|nr:hypothetical protein [Candidatus Methanomethylophilaceae archaeon]